VAETEHKVKILLAARDQAGSVVGGLTKTLGGLATAAAGLAAGAVAGVGALGAGLADLAIAAAPIEQVRSTFFALTESIGEQSYEMMAALRDATNGMVSDADLMGSANKLISMGLAESTEEAAKLSEMAVRLGSAMGEDAVGSMENFALMMANQSIPRLDSFGISSAKVRERINELMESVEGMDRETAFMTAVTEQGAVAMERLGDAGKEGAASSMARLQATMENLKASVGSVLLPVLDTLATMLVDLIGPNIDLISELVFGMGQALLDGLAPALQMVIELFSSDAFMDFLTEFAGALTQLLTQIATLLLNDVLPPLFEMAQNLLPILTSLLSAVLDVMLPLIAELASRFVPVLMELMNAILPAILPLFEMLADVFLMVIDAVLPVATTLLELLIPPLMELISALLPALMPLLSGLMEAFVQILEALMPVVEILLAELLPIFVELIIALIPPLTELLLAVVDIFVQLLQAVLPVIVALVEQLAPIIAELAGLIEAGLNVALEALTGLIENVVGPAIEWLKETIIDPLIGSLEGVSDAVGDVIDWIGRMAEKLRNVSLPDWLTPGSPTPFEVGLRGIASALNDVASMTAPAFGGVAGAGAPAAAGAGAGGMVNIVVNIGSVTEGNAYEAGQKAGQGITDELRRQGVIVG